MNFMTRLTEDLKTVFATFVFLSVLWNVTAYPATVTLTVVGNPAAAKWGVGGTIADTRDVMTDVYLDGVLHHTEHDAPYACCFGDDGTNVLTGSFGAGSHTIMFVFKLEGTTTEVGRNSITVVEGPVGGVPGPPTISVALVTAPVLGNATVTWNANVESDLSGYKVYMTTTSGVYGAPFAVLGKSTSCFVPNLQPGTTYFFTVSAYDQSQNESALSKEVNKLIP